MSISPSDGNSNVGPSSTITLRFSENVKAGYGLIALTTAGGSVIETFSVSSSSRLSFDGGTQLTIRPTQPLPYGTEFVLSVPAGAVLDIAGNGYAGLSGYDFTTMAAPDTTAPSLTGGTPAQGSTGVSLSADLLVQFSEAIARGNGTITLRTSTGAEVERFDAASPRVTISGSTLRIDPSLELAASTTYRIELPSGSIKDLVGNATTGALSLQFTTQPPAARNLTGTAGADRLEGGLGADRLEGADGNDLLIGLAGNDDLRGGDGIDLAQFSLARSAYQLTATGTGWQVRANTGDEGTDTLAGVERLAFSDRHVALDLSGNAGTAAKLIGALLGPALVQDRGLAGIALGLLDGGMSSSALAQLGVEAAGMTAGSGTQAALSQMWRNVFGTEPDMPTVDALADQVGRGELSLATIALIAAELPSNAARIDLVGLTSHGLEYVATGP